MCYHRGLQTTVLCPKGRVVLGQTTHTPIYIIEINIYKVIKSEIWQFQITHMNLLLGFYARQHVELSAY